MRLNETQLLVIKRTRDVMQENKFSSPYICHNVAQALRELHEEGVVPDEDVSSMKHNLSTAILAGIGHMVTFGGFMLLICPPLKAMHDAEPVYFYKVQQMARLAWLDWIIETREIRQDLLAGEE